MHDSYPSFFNYGQKSLIDLKQKFIKNYTARDRLISLCEPLRTLKLSNGLIQGIPLFFIRKNEELLLVYVFQY